MASIEGGSRKLSGLDRCRRLLTEITATGVVAAVGVLGFGLSQALASGAIPSQDPEPPTTDTSTSTSTTEPTPEPVPEPVPDDPLPTPDPAPSQTVKPDPAPRTSQPRTQVRDTPQTRTAKIAPPSKEILEPLTTQPDEPARAPVQEPRLRQSPAKDPARGARQKRSAPKVVIPEDRTPTRVKALGGTVTMAAESAHARRAATDFGLVLAVLAVGVVFVYLVSARL